MRLSVRDFRFGQTLSGRIREGDPRKMASIAGFDVSRGYARPDKYPSKVSGAALSGTMAEQIPIVYRDADGARIVCRDASSKLQILGVDGDWEPAGNWQSCTLALTTDLVTCTGHGYSAGAGIQFSATTGGVTVGTTYYVIAAGLTADVFAFSTTAGGSAFNITANGSNTVASITGAEVGVISDGNPVRLGPLIVFPTTSGPVVFEPDSATTRTRPLSLNGPLDYDADMLPTEAMTVTALPTTHEATQVFDISADTADDEDCWQKRSGDGGDTYVAAGHQILTWQGETSPNDAYFGMDLGSSGVDFDGFDFFVMDLSLGYATWDPTEYIIKGGEFCNSDLMASGWLLVLYSDQAYTTEIARFTIPQIKTNGAIHRVVLHLGDTSGWSTTTVKSIGIEPADYFTTGGESGVNYNLHVYSEDHADDWECKGNWLLPAIKFSHSPWCDRLPPDSGAKTAEVAHPTSATILETFNEAMTNFTPDRPRARWTYIFRGRSALSVDDYDQMLSNRAVYSEEVFADPWRLYAISVTLPTNDDSADVLDDYADFVTHGVVYRQTYTGLGSDKSVLTLGVWDTPEYVGNFSLSKDNACTMNVAADTISATAHGRTEFDIVYFGTTVGGVTAGTKYYVISSGLTADVFKISTTAGGSALNITGDEGAANTYTALCYQDIGRVNYPCAMVNTGDLIDMDGTAHRVYVGDIATFSATAGGVTRGVSYYVYATPVFDQFQIATTPDADAAMELTADVAATAQSFSSAGKVRVIDDDIDRRYQRAVPQYLELSHQAADEAKYLAVADTRLYAGGLTYDSDASAWTRLDMMMVSNLGDYGSFPTIPTNLTIDGQELGPFSPDSYTVKGLLAKNDAVFVWTEKGMWELVGSDADSPWRFLRRDAIGSASAKTQADCRSQIIWHGPEDSHFYAFAGGLVQPISKDIIDSSLFTWTNAHQGVYSNERYVFFGYYNSAWTVFVYDLANGAWRWASNAAFQFAGMCVDDATGDVYALTSGGEIVNVFGALEFYGAESTIRTLDTGYLEAPGGAEWATSNFILDTVTAEDTLDLTVSVYAQSRLDASDTDNTVPVVSTRTWYGAGDLNPNLKGRAFRILVTYTGAAPPEIYEIGLDLGEEPVEV